MNAPKIITAYGACALAASLLVSPVLAQQQKPLSMTYQLLGINAEAAQPAPAPANRCAALNWVTSIGACGRDLLAKISPRAERAPHAEPMEPGVAVVPAASGGTFALAPESTVSRTEALSAAELPTLGSADSRYLRASAAREAPIGSSRAAADLSLRVGSKHRFRGTEENGWDWYRFSDTTYQTHVQNNGHKALGVELLVPFQ